MLTQQRKPILAWGTCQGKKVIALPPPLVWRAEFPEKRCVAELQQIAFGIGFLMIFDHANGDRSLAGWHETLPLPLSNDETWEYYADQWEAKVRNFLYPKSQPPVVNMYRRGRRK